ncbi:MAG: DoxX family protein [Gracilimonas sp.]|uniref:DoxX family protein n=1 Tax=Gracilimonas TaxID=649462 RepID=UPI001B1701CE|nr:DoxX family protein [Gracilimonas sp.]MBO6585281.1 DoxX family protein [Gracilimonas sp.]MBO6616277.1 DoxX family protein [Gracilimonas sp.]
MKNKDLAKLLLRIGVGVIFIIAGWSKLSGIEGVQGFFGNIGIPLPGVMAWVVALVEFVGGIMVLVGYKVEIPGILLAFTMLVAILTVKMGGDNGFSGMRLELMLLLTSLALSMMGTGKYSLDDMLGTSGGDNSDAAPI